MSTYEQELSDRRFRAWCFTINNYTIDDIRNVTKVINDAKGGIAEEEHTGEDEGTPHIQGYVYFNTVKSFDQIKALLGIRAHVEPSRGNPKQNFDYCSKEGKVFIEKGLPSPKDGENFLEMYECMLKSTPEEFARRFPKEWYLRRQQVERVMIDSAMKHVQDYAGELKEKNIWVWGLPGVGKSRWAASNGTYEEIFKKNFNKWWDGYNLLSTKIVIIEDYPCVPQGNVLVQHMKIWGDRYPFEAECKGSHMMVEPKRFFLIITSNYPIERCFENQEDIDAIKRRFKEIKMENGDLMSQCITKLNRNVIQ